MAIKQRLTPGRAQRLGKSYRQMYALAVMMDLEYSQHMDVHFKDPITHNHIKRIAESIKVIQSRHKSLIDSSAEISILDGMFDLNEINRMFLGMTSERIQEFAKGMRREIEKEEAEQLTLQTQ